MAAVNEDLLPFADPAYWHDPYPYYDRVRELTPVYASPAGVHVLTRHADISTLVRDPRLSALELSFGVGDPFHDSVLGQDSPDHTRLRRVLQPWFSGPRVRSWAADTRARCEASLARARRDGGMDLIDDYAFPATFATASVLFGVGTGEARACRHHTYVIGRALAPGADDDDMAAGRASLEWYFAYVASLIDEKRTSPGDDLMTAFIAALDDGTMTLDEVKATMTLLYAVGHLDNTYLIANGALQLIGRPDLRRRFVEDEAIRPAAIQELLRHETPEQFVVRAVVDDIDVDGHGVPGGAVLMCMIGCANRDPRVFDRPAELDFDRPNLSRQIAFGVGIHTCIGSLLARAQGEIGIALLFEQFPDVALAGGVEFCAHRVPARYPAHARGPLSAAERSRTSQIDCQAGFPAQVER